MKSLRILATGLATLTLAVAVQAAQPVVFEFSPQTFSYPSDPGTFRSSIRWGEIAIEGHDGDEVLVTVRVVPEHNRPASATPVDDLIDFRINEADNVMDLLVDSRIEGFYGIKLTVAAPRTTRLQLEITDGGEISVRGVNGEVDVVNRNGSVELDGLGANAVVDARNGSIVASFDTVDPELPMSFSTLNGSIDVTVPDDVAADLRIRHNYGGVESDFLLFDRAGKSVAADLDTLDPGATRVLQAEINGGGPRYDFFTANGTVYLRKGRRVAN